MKRELKNFRSPKYLRLSFFKDDDLDTGETRRVLRMRPKNVLFSDDPLPNLERVKAMLMKGLEEDIDAFFKKLKKARDL